METPCRGAGPCCSAGCLSISIQPKEIRLELDLPFALKIIYLIQSNEFLALLNLANTPETCAKGECPCIGAGGHAAGVPRERWMNVCDPANSSSRVACYPLRL